MHKLDPTGCQQGGSSRRSASGQHWAAREPGFGTPSPCPPPCKQQLNTPSAAAGSKQGLRPLPSCTCSVHQSAAHHGSQTNERGCRPPSTPVECRTLCAHHALGAVLNAAVPLPYPGAAHILTQLSTSILVPRSPQVTSILVRPEGAQQAPHFNFGSVPTFATCGQFSFHPSLVCPCSSTVTCYPSTAICAAHETVVR